MRGQTSRRGKWYLFSQLKENSVETERNRKIIWETARLLSGKSSFVVKCNVCHFTLNKSSESDVRSIDLFSTTRHQNTRVNLNESERTRAQDVNKLVFHSFKIKKPGQQRFPLTFSTGSQHQIVNWAGKLFKTVWNLSIVYSSSPESGVYADLIKRTLKMVYPVLTSSTDHQSQITNFRRDQGEYSFPLVPLSVFLASLWLKDEVLWWRLPLTVSESVRRRARNLSSFLFTIAYKSSITHSRAFQGLHNAPTLVCKWPDL